jgi:hypothetical protein
MIGACRGIPIYERNMHSEASRQSNKVAPVKYSEVKNPKVSTWLPFVDYVGKSFSSGHVQEQGSPKIFGRVAGKCHSRSFKL